MYHEPTIAEMIAQSDGWAWAYCDACHQRAPLNLVQLATALGFETGILALAQKLRCV